MKKIVRFSKIFSKKLRIDLRFDLSVVSDGITPTAAPFIHGAMFIRMAFPADEPEVVEAECDLGLLDRHRVEFDDVMHNALGTALGVLIVLGMRRLRK